MQTKVKQKKRYARNADLLRYRVNALRKISPAFSSKAGYNLNHIYEWSPQHVASLNRRWHQVQDWLDKLPSTGYHFEKLGKEDRKKLTYPTPKPSFVQKDFLPDTPPHYEREILASGVSFVNDTGFRQGILLVNVKHMVYRSEAFFDHLFAEIPDTVFVLTSNQSLFASSKFGGGVITTPEIGVSMIKALTAKYQESIELWSSYLRYYRAPKQSQAFDVMLKDVTHDLAEREAYKKDERKIYRQFKESQKARKRKRLTGK